MSLPECAEYCFDTGLSDNGCLDAVDFYCQCPRSNSLITEMTPCLLNLCSSLEMTQAVIYWQTLCMMAVSSIVAVPGFATNLMGIAMNPTMSVPKTTSEFASISRSVPVVPTFAPSIGSLPSDFSFLVSETAPRTDDLASETGASSAPTGGSFLHIESSSSSSLSTGAKSGIAVGVVGIALAVALGVWLFCRRRRRSKAAAPEQYAAGNAVFSEKMPVVTTTQSIEPKNYPSSSVQRKQVQHSHTYPEMDGRIAVSPVSAPDRSYENELEGQYWPATHERRGELPG